MERERERERERELYISLVGMMKKKERKKQINKSKDNNWKIKNYLLRERERGKGPKVENDGAVKTIDFSKTFK